MVVSTNQSLDNDFQHLGLQRRPGPGGHSGFGTHDSARLQLAVSPPFFLRFVYSWCVPPSAPSRRTPCPPSALGKGRRSSPSGQRAGYAEQEGSPGGRHGWRPKALSAHPSNPGLQRLFPLLPLFLSGASSSLPPVAIALLPPRSAPVARGRVPAGRALSPGSIT